ncbi:condensation domain-containing protein [Serratia symbiotica]|uniref:condensation domain-containing protein n=1 Tax=Serratia symbiotica TaxID=138074 RepID=UPI001D372142|nr:condensation domain-containing protein [Serratia symbiotica]NIG88035.1 hypothetical protein [Serratia symbiotica]USS96508.1 condensation domain-containing protein [Serratia symbiotica]
MSQQFANWTIEQHLFDEPDTAASSLAHLSEQLSHKVYDPTQWPLFAIHVANYPQQGECRQRLFVSLDSMMLDGRSIMVLFTEWDQLYQQSDTVLPNIDIRYRDYVLQNQPAAERVQQAQAWWQQHLADLPGHPALPLAVTPKSLQQPRFRRWSHELSRQQWRKLKATAQRRVGGCLR